MKNERSLVPDESDTGRRGLPRMLAWSAAIALMTQGVTLSMARQQPVSTNKSIDEIRDIFEFFHTPANVVQLQVASDRTRYAWQNLSAFQYTMQIERDRPISELPEHFETSATDAMLVLHQGNVAYARYKTKRPFDKHQWFSSGKVVPGTMLELLALEGRIDISRPVSDYVPELQGSDWDAVTVEETLDMATGLDSTEHEEPNDDARINPIRGWYKWAVSIGLFEDKENLNQSPFDVLRNMKKV